MTLTALYSKWKWKGSEWVPSILSPSSLFLVSVPIFLQRMTDHSILPHPMTEECKEIEGKGPLKAVCSIFITPIVLACLK